MCHYTHLTPFEREKILFFLAEGKSITEIAHLLKRSKETASQERQRRTSWQVRHIAPHRRASCQCSEPFRPWPLGSGYCGGQARKGMGLLREFFPKGKDITDTPEDYIQRKYHELNLRPRKCLGYKTLYEVYFSKVLHLA